MTKFLLTLLLALGTLTAFAEDWTTTDGKKYENVTVIKIEDDAVTISYKDGGALVPLTKLPPELQRRFQYDPTKAKIASEKRAQEEQVSLQVEIQERQAMSDKKLAQEAAAEKAKAQRAAVEELKSHAIYLRVEIRQILPHGILAQALDEGTPLFIETSPDNLTEGQELVFHAARTGTFTFTDVQGASRTVEKWMALEAPHPASPPVAPAIGDSLQSVGGG